MAEDFFSLTFGDNSTLFVRVTNAASWPRLKAVSDLTVRKLRQLLFAGQEQQLVAVRISSPVDAPGVDVIRIAVV